MKCIVYSSAHRAPRDALVISGGVKCNNNARRAVAHSPERARKLAILGLCLFIYLLIYLNAYEHRAGPRAANYERRGFRREPRRTQVQPRICSSRSNLKFIFRMNPEWSRCIEHFRRAEVCALRNFGEATCTYRYIRRVRLAGFTHYFKSHGLRQRALLRSSLCTDIYGY